MDSNDQFLHPDINYCHDNQVDHEEHYVPSQATQEEQPTQINGDIDDWVPTASQLEPISEGPTPWATLHNLTVNVPKKILMSNVNVLCIGRVKNRNPPRDDFKEDLVIKTDHKTNISISRKHCIIQRKGVGDDDFDDRHEDGGDDFVRQMRRNATMPYNGHSGREVISLLDLSSNGTFINGKRCTPGKWTKLDHGDHIALGSVPGQVDRPNRAFEWMISIPSQRTFPMNKKPEAHSSVGRQLYERYDLISPLGQGAFATTWKAFDRNHGDFKAIKIIQKSEHKHNEQNLVNFQREVDILRLVKHPNIVKFWDHQQDDEYIWIVLELVDGGEYLDYVCNADGLDEESCRVITAMLLQALAYLAALNIAHRDLKPENILMTSGANPRPKIADFGLARQLVGPDARFKTQCGTPAYLAPEVVVPALNSKQKGYTVAVDMYSLGVIVYAALGNCSPFDGQEQKGDIRQICKTRKVDPNVLALLKPNISSAALDFITQLTEKNVEKRLTADQALRHRWIMDAVAQWPPTECQLPSNHTHSSQSDDEPNGCPMPRPTSPSPPEDNLDSLVNERLPPTVTSSLFDVRSNATGPENLSPSSISPSTSARPVENRAEVEASGRKPTEVTEVCSQQLGNMRLETPNRRCYANAHEEVGQNHCEYRFLHALEDPKPTDWKSLAGQTSAPPSCGNTVISGSTPSPFSTSPRIGGMRSNERKPPSVFGSKRKLRQWSTSPKLLPEEPATEPESIPELKVRQPLQPDLAAGTPVRQANGAPPPVSGSSTPRRSTRITALRSNGRKVKAAASRSVSPAISERENHGPALPASNEASRRKRNRRT